MTRTQIIDHLRAGRPLNAKLVKEIVDELEKAQRLEEALRSVEWVYDRNYQVYNCPSCGNEKPDDHSPDCRLEKALEDKCKK